MNYILKSNQPLTYKPNQDGLYDILDCEIYLWEEEEPKHVFNCAASEEVLIDSIESRANFYLDKKYKEQEEVLLFVHILDRIKQKES
jgi:hypothetical protein